MIRIPAGRVAVLRELGDGADSWLGHADALTRENALAKRHKNIESLWTQIKSTLAALQRARCAYCGRRLGSAGQDSTVDHFRPKGEIAACDDLPANMVDVGGHSPVGYYLLAYDIDNFLVACAPCNRSKKNVFPTSRTRRVATADKAVLRTERPLLLHPADEDDLDPAHLLAWQGVMMAPAPGLGRREYDRAVATIHILDLNREELLRSRAQVLIGMTFVFELAPDHPRRRRFIDGVCAPHAEHAACARAFGRLWETAHDEAHALLPEIERLALD